MPEQTHTAGVVFPDGESASTFLLRLLRGAREAFPDALGALDVPRRGRDLKRAYPALLVEAEQRRVASPDRAAIARHVQREVAGAMGIQDDAGARRPLTALGLDAEALPVDALPGQGTPGWRPATRYRDRAYEGDGLRALVEDLAGRHRVCPAAAATLRRALDRLDADGRLDLSGERFALLGAGAEIAPTRALLAAGATVLWTDVVPPPSELRALPGTLMHARGRGDLLQAPDRVAATVARFAEDGPVHLGLFAYGPGKGREWRLGAAMNAVARALPADALRSVGLYVSPTSPAAVSGADRAEAERRFRERPGWQRALLATRLLTPARVEPTLPRVADTVVGLQGVSYQAAQWVEKTLALEALAADRPDLRVSANVAPVTETRSLEHPVFAAAFRGAPVFGVESFAPEVTRTLCALAYVEDVTGATPPGPDPRQLHGGLFALPYALDGAIRVAAARGLLMRR